MTAPSRPSRPRGSTVAAAVIAALGLVGFGLAVAARLGDPPYERRARARDLVAALGLTDLALFTEARYMRNPALADLHSAFQDGPASLEHFPTGALVVAPRRFGQGRLEAGSE